MVERIRTLLETRQLTPTQFADIIGIARPIVSHILSGRNKPSLEVVQRILAAMPDLSMPWLLNGSGSMWAAESAPVKPLLAPQVLPVPEAAPQQPVTLPVTSPAPTGKQENQDPSGLAGAVAAPAGAPVPLQGRRRPYVPNTTVSPATMASVRRFTPSVPSNPLRSAAVMPSAPEPVPVPVHDAVAVPPIAEATVPAMSMAALAQAPPQPAPAVAVDAMALVAGSPKPIRRIVVFYRDGSFADYQPE